MRRHSFDDVCGRFDGVNKPGRFSEPYTRVVGIAFIEGLPVARTFDGNMALQIVFPSVPAIGKGIASNSCRESSRPINLPSDVGDAGPKRSVAVRFEDRCVVALVHQGLVRRP